jgi:hypothetical protein
LANLQVEDAAVFETAPAAAEIAARLLAADNRARVR